MRPPTGGRPSHHVAWPNRVRAWNYYRWHFNPYNRPWYTYGYARHPSGYYPGYEYGYYYTGLWRCTAYDDVAENHENAHPYTSASYNVAYDTSLALCQQFHQNCVVSCERVDLASEESADAEATSRE